MLGVQCSKLINMVNWRQIRLECAIQGATKLRRSNTLLHVHGTAFHMPLRRVHAEGNCKPLLFTITTVHNLPRALTLA
jgi:hypothetical protein